MLIIIFNFCTHTHTHTQNEGSKVQKKNVLHSCKANAETQAKATLIKTEELRVQQQFQASIAKSHEPIIKGTNTYQQKKSTNITK